MKSKILRTVSAVMLSAFLTIAAVPCSTEAAANVEPKACKHNNVTEIQISVSYPNAISSEHQVSAVCDRYCNDCPEYLGRVTHIYSESHSFGANRRCTKCGYYDH